jgi:hypothetical protein
MRRWFLSYNSQDLALMQSLEGALRRKDADTKLFFAPKACAPALLHKNDRCFWRTRDAQNMPALAKQTQFASVGVLVATALRPTVCARR